jgi:hypothetical protein
MITSYETKFNWLKILMMSIKHQRLNELCFLFRMTSNWKLIDVCLYNETRKAWYLTNAILIMNKLHIISFFFSTIHRTVSNVDHRSDVYIHLFVYSTLSPFFTGSQWAYWWLIDKHGLCRRNGQLNREYTFEQHNRTLMAWHWQHKGLVVL